MREKSRWKRERERNGKGIIAVRDKEEDGKGEERKAEREDE